MLPLSLWIGRQRPTEALDVEVTAGGQLEHALAQGAPSLGEPLHHVAGQRFQPRRATHPELGQLAPPQIAGTTDEASPGEGADHGAQGLDIEGDRAIRVGGPMWMDQIHQTGGQVTGQA